MSEYQYYEFLAVDRPLDDHQQAEVRWMMERYNDAHLYLTNRGTHRIMLRLPRNLLDIDVAEDHCVGDQVTLWTTGKFLVLDMTSEDDSGDGEYDPQGKLSAIVGARTELAAGDLRPLYLAWLASYGAWERDEDAFDRDEDHELEPPVPPGLTPLTGAQQALADFLRLDDDLLASQPRQVHHSTRC